MFSTSKMQTFKTTAQIIRSHFVMIMICLNLTALNVSSRTFHDEMALMTHGNVFIQAIMN